MYKFATNIFAAVGIFGIGVLSATWIVANTNDRLAAEKTAEPTPTDNLDAAWTDVQNLIKQ